MASPPGVAPVPLRAGCCPALRGPVDQTTTRRLFLLATAVAALYPEDFTGKVVAHQRRRYCSRHAQRRCGPHPAIGDRLPRGKAAILDAGETVHWGSGFRQTVMVKVRDIDQCKRTAAETILPDGWNLNQKLDRVGLAWWYQQCARPGDGAVGSGAGAGGAGGEAWAVDRPEAGDRGSGERRVGSNPWEPDICVNRRRK
jgi:hypothetical protein